MGHDGAIPRGEDVGGLGHSDPPVRCGLGQGIYGSKRTAGPIVPWRSWAPDLVPPPFGLPVPSSAGRLGAGWPARWTPPTPRMPQARQLDHLGNRVTASPTPRHPLTHRQGLTVLTRRFTACRQPGRRDV